MFAVAHMAPVFDSANTTKPLIQKKLLRSYPKVVYYLLKKFSKDQPIAEIDSKIFYYTQLAHMTSTHNACDKYI